MVTDTIIAIGAVISAVILICGSILRIVKWFERQRRQDQDIKDIKEEDAMLCYCLFAVLDGLKQLGANGNVTKAKNDLQKYLNQKSHCTKWKGDTNED